MKISPLLLAGSLAVNATLVFAFVQRPTVRAWLSPTSHPASTGTNPAASGTSSSGSAAGRSPESWSQLTTGELSDVVARLRAEGYPPKLVRTIMTALVAERFADRHKTIADAVAAKPWWQGQPGETSLADQKITAMRRRLNSDEQDLLYKLLGPDTAQSDYDRAWTQRRYGNLDPDRIAQLSRLNSDYSDLMADIRAQGRNIILPEDREKLAFLEEQKRADLEKLLSPNELFEYNLRTSAIANRLHDQLNAFNPTEDEFRTIFKVQQDFDAQYGDGRIAFLTVDERRERRNSLGTVTEQLKSVLSPERFADYQLMTDPAYLQTDQLVTSLALPATATAQIVGVQRDTTSRMTAIIADKSLTAGQRGVQLAALAQEATATLTGTLGESGLATYKAGNGGWLTSLEQRAARLRPATPPVARPAPTP